MKKSLAIELLKTKIWLTKEELKVELKVNETLLLNNKLVRLEKLLEKQLGR